MTRFNPLHPVPCVYFKHGAYWLVKQKKWTRIGATLEDALAEYARRQSQPKGGMAELIDKVLAHHGRDLSSATLEQYQVAAKLLKRKLVQFAPEQVKPKHVAALKLSMSDTPNMANRTLSFLRVVFRYAVEWQLVESNPCIGIARHREQKRRRYITDDEFWRIHAHAGQRLKLVMLAQYLTGQRINDVLGIRRSQLTDDGIEFEQQKTSARLVVKWTSELRDTVRDALALHRGVPALTLFLGRSGKPPDYRSVLLQWDEACRAAGVEDAKPNDLRAKSLTDAKAQGQDATALAGHTGPAMTARYLRDRKAPVVAGPSLAPAKGAKLDSR